MTVTRYKAAGRGRYHVLSVVVSGQRPKI